MIRAINNLFKKSQHTFSSSDELLSLDSSEAASSPYFVFTAKKILIVLENISDLIYKTHCLLLYL